jgi:hypothetical protein
MVHSPVEQAAEPLRGIVARQISGSCDFPDDQRDQLLEQIRKRYGSGLLAVLIYGSYLRGKRDTLLHAPRLAWLAGKNTATQRLPNSPRLTAG